MEFESLRRSWCGLRTLGIDALFLVLVSPLIGAIVKLTVGGVWFTEGTYNCGQNLGPLGSLRRGNFGEGMGCLRYPYEVKLAYQHK